jgi:predicted membrane protein
MRFKVKIPKSFIFWVILVCIIALLVALFIYPDIEDVFFYIRTAIVAWTALIILALIGAIFIGMLLSHRILSIGGFTPFEEEMLKMREDIKEINRRLEKLIGEANMDKKVGDEGKLHNGNNAIKREEEVKEK